MCSQILSFWKRFLSDGHSTIFAACCWTSSCKSYLYWEAQNLYITSGVVSPVHKIGEKMTFDLLVVLFLMQPRILLAFFELRVDCWCTVTLLFTMICFFLPRSFPADQSPAYTDDWHFSTPNIRLCIFAMPSSPVHWGPSEQQHNALVYQLPLPGLYQQGTFWGCPLSQCLAQ